jgi:hypothetical protein
VDKLKIRVFDTKKERYGKILFLSFLRGEVGYGVYDKFGDPVEIKPTIQRVKDCILEVNIEGYWCVVDIAQFRATCGKLMAISFFHNEADIDDKVVSLNSNPIEISIGGTWQSVELEAV